MDVKMIVLGIVLILVTITLLRYIFASYSKLDGLKNAKSVTKVSPSSISTTNSNNYAYPVWSRYQTTTVDSIPNGIFWPGPAATP